MKFTPLVGWCIQLLMNFTIVLWLSIHLFGGISVYTDAPDGDFRHQPASVPTQQRPSYDDVTDDAVCAMQCYRPSILMIPDSWQKYRQGRPAFQLALGPSDQVCLNCYVDVATVSHMVAQRVMVSLPTPALGTEAIEQHVWALVNKFHFLWEHVSCQYKPSKQQK